MSRFLLSLALLAIIYALVLGSFNPWNILAGSAISGALIILYRQFLFKGQASPIAGSSSATVGIYPFHMGYIS